MTTFAVPLSAGDQEKRRVPRSVYIALAVGIAAGASAGMSTRFALEENISPLAIAFFRLSMAWVLITPIVMLRYRDELRRLSRRDLILAAISGVFMAAHFVMWSASLIFASVMVASVIVCSSPIWAAIFEITFLKAKLTRMILIGLVLAVGGNVLIAVASNGGGGTDQVLGGFIAMVAAILIAAQRTIGRDIRCRLTVFPFLWLMYGFGTLALTFVMGATGTPVIGYTPRGYFFAFMLALLPQLLGHGSFNYALGFFSATYTSLIVQTQPPISTIMAYFAFDEIPTPLQLIGAVVIVSGVFTAVRGRQIQISTVTPPQTEPSSPQ